MAEYIENRYECYLPDIVAENIRNRRTAMGASKYALASVVGTSITNITHWESGKHLPDLQNICTLADFFGCAVDELLGRCG